MKATGLPDTLTFSVTPNPVAIGAEATFNVTVANPAGSTGGTPAGYVEFYDGSTIIGGPCGLINGSCTFGNVFSQAEQTILSVWYSGDLTHVSNMASQSESVKIIPNVSMNAPYSITTAQVLSAVITVSGGAGNPTPTGSVTLNVWTSLTGTGYTSPAATLTNGSAPINIPAGTFAAGSYGLTPTYTPDTASSSVYLGGTLIGRSIEVTTPPPTFTVSGTTVTLAPGATAGNTSTITLTPVAGFTGNVTLFAAITASPAGAQYPPTFSFGSTSPVAITGTNSVTATLTVTTTAASNSAYLQPKDRSLRWCGVGGASMALMLLLGMRRRQFRWGATLKVCLLLLVLSGAGLACSGGGGGNSGGGGGGGSGNPGTTAGTYTVTVTGTSGSVNATGSITMSVQ